MNVKNTIAAIVLFISAQMFAQNNQELQANIKLEPKISYLDSIKKTFVKHRLAASVDSLWIKELTSLDLYNTISDDIQNGNFDQKIDFELPTDLLKKRLAAIDAKSPFNIEYNIGLENIIKSFLKNRKRSFERLMAVSEYYFPLFEEALARKNVPLEIKYLAVVESALNPKAVSRMGATGLWQFMYQTGKQYGLKIDSYVDERSDPLKASEAAANYMTNMFKIFGDWDLVLASYNSGPGNVSKAIRRSGGQQNYWNIRKNLPKETQGYVPAFLATMYIYEYHKEHGIVPEKAFIKHFATDTIRIKQQLTFKQISDLLDVPVAQLQLLNPSYKLNVVPYYHDQEHFLRLPQDKIAVFASNEDKMYAYAKHEMDQREKPFQMSRAVVVKDSIGTKANDSGPKSSFYRVQRGDNLTNVAAKYDVTVAEIKQWNNLRSNSLAYGKSLRIEPPTGKQDKIITKSIRETNPVVAVSTSSKIVKDDKEATTSSEAIYVVQKGDNLGNIAKKHNVSVADIQSWNGLTTDAVQIGATIQIAKLEVDTKQDLANAQERRDVEYVVQKGDNLSAIASKFGTSLSDIKQWNKLNDNTITIGKSLIVAKDEIAIVTDKASVNSFKTKASAMKSKGSSSDYYVKKGDSLFSIAKKYPGVTTSDLKKWNGISGEQLKPGMKLKING
ncbi:LysM peptidoglycan-binding domain-containing protein [Flavobacterium turcicum]|uniref:LysM peptidoglycan-binding domain-containing protein n=1 Tax=Flavobacterium turcicum TaxID=2764718 RepID=A0ABR7JBR4_9FLAO|nr:LysM peptidoglycan-binding domain-containing protein [Flavobacterium turcicum]MBC5861929.1 LysM peptidoglycan-binding domain-containing protein [Flavobacterium turcicum]NHL00660.1 LysM peptidoglycan-binding domain-containing protein [Flavobacterium turcicum]